MKYKVSTTCDSGWGPAVRPQLPGSGLELAIAREIVVEHGGEIECVPDVARGAEFRVVLPVVTSLFAVPDYKEVSFDVA